jgi:hypothetical protein
MSLTLAAALLAQGSHLQPMGTHWTVNAAAAGAQDQGPDPAALNQAPAGPSYTTQAPPPDQTGADDSGYAEQPTATAPQPPPALPEYQQPPPPAEGYIWTPGYWAWSPTGYYWVPGAWVEPPYMDALWTPGYWGFYGGRYLFYPGHWGRHIGFYGGINYGFGYIGLGYEGGYWNSGQFFYNRVYNNVGGRGGAQRIQLQRRQSREEPSSRKRQSAHELSRGSARGAGKAAVVRRRSVARADRSTHDKPGTARAELCRGSRAAGIRESGQAGHVGRQAAAESGSQREAAESQGRLAETSVEIHSRVPACGGTRSSQSDSRPMSATTLTERRSGRATGARWSRSPRASMTETGFSMSRRSSADNCNDAAPGVSCRRAVVHFLS